MNLYQVTWPKGGDYGSFVVCCENEDIARRTHPGFYVVDWWKISELRGQGGEWVQPDQLDELKVKFLGTICPDTLEAVILSSFKAR